MCYSYIHFNQVELIPKIIQSSVFRVVAEQEYSSPLPILLVDVVNDD